MCGECFAFCVKAKKKHLVKLRHFILSSELSILFISFRKFSRKELSFLVTYFLFVSGSRSRYLSSKIAYASFFSSHGYRIFLDLTSHKAGSGL